MEIKPEHLDTVIFFNRRNITLRFLDRSEYQKLYDLCPEYFNIDIKPTKWSDRFDATPLFKLYEIKHR